MRDIGLKWGGLLTALALFAPTGAAAQEPIPIDELFPPEAQWLANCPTDDAFPDGFGPEFCLNLVAYDGELKLGDTQATIDDPIEVAAGIGLKGGEAVIVTGNGDGDGGAASVSEVKVPGGLLGIPELDPLLDPLGLLTVTATPQIGDGLSAESRLPIEQLEEIILPLSIELNNVLFGEDCSIGTPEDPFVINLTTGTTAPPAGVEPISGHPGVEQPQLRYFGLGAPGALQQIGGNLRAVPSTTRSPSLGRTTATR